MSTVTFSSSSGGELTQAIVEDRLGSATTVIIEGYTSIGDRAFNGVYWIKSVTISNSVTTISNFAFRDCYSLYSITIPTSVTTISVNAFIDSNLHNVFITNNQVISGITFLSPSLNISFFGRTVNIPFGSVTFKGTGTLTRSIVNAGLGSAHIVIIEGYTVIDSKAFFEKYQITSVTMSNSVIGIYNEAFTHCLNLSSILLSNSLNYLHAAFINCPSLTSITIPKSIEVINHNYTFYACTALTSVVIKDPSITYVRTDVFPNVSTLNSSITFYNTASYNDLSETWKTISRYYKTQVYIPAPILPVITFPAINAKYGDSSTISYISNSSGAVTFTSSDTSIATINGSTITFVGVGRAIITATQSETDSFLSKTTTCSLTVVKSNPIIRNVINNFVNNESQISFDSTSSGTYSYSFSDNSAVKINPNNTFTFLKNCSVIVTIHQDETSGYVAGTYSAIIDHP